MIQLATKNLDPEIQQTLNTLQAKIDTKSGFQLRVKEAHKLWKSKGGANNKRRFQLLKQELEALCKFEKTCVYCEQNEGTDIEHVFPKSYFPEYTFDWQNLLLACKTCNTHYKLDQVHVLDDNDDVVKVQRGSMPNSQYVAFINPRKENPSNYMLVSFPSFKFELLPELSKAAENKAHSTIEILDLNSRDLLIEARKKTARYYFERIDRLLKILETENIEILKTLLNPIDEYFDFNISLTELKKEIKQSIQSDIQNHQHPSVWQSIKLIQSKVHPKWRDLFVRFPEALDW